MKIGIYTAMEAEAKSFIQGDFTVEKVGAFVFYKFCLVNCDAVLCLPPHVGEITAAAGTQLLIDRYGVDMVLNFGVVGALTEYASSLQTVYCKFVSHYQMDTSAIDDCEVGYYQVFATKNIPTDVNLIDIARSAVDLPVVGCASGDKFVADSVEKTNLSKEFGAQICDMESAGILITCKYNNVPCLFVKCIADTLFGGAEDYKTKIANIVYDFKTIAEQICKKYAGNK